MLCATLNHQLRHYALSSRSLTHAALYHSTEISQIVHPNSFTSIRAHRPCAFLGASGTKSNFTHKRINLECADQTLHSQTQRQFCSSSQSFLSFPQQNIHLPKDTKLFIPGHLNTHNIISSCEGHLLSRNKIQCNVPRTVLAYNVLHTKAPGSTEYTKNAINIPKFILDSSPLAVQPYLQMIRFDRPIGTWLLYWPCTWSIALAAQPGCWPDFYMLALFGSGAFFMRGAGCIINDMWDRDFDNKVERTRGRPLTSGQVTFPQAFVFLGSQLAISLAILCQLNWYSICLGAASMGIVITYPAFKRFTYWPQIVLGFAFNYGALLGWAAVQGSCDWSICLPLYFLCHMWTMIYDTVYAHQDKTDDLLIGVKSTALRFGDQTKPWLAGFTAMMAGGLLYVGYGMDMTWPYYTGATLTVASIVRQLYRLDIDNPQACGDAFRFHFYIGLLMFVSIVAGNLARPKKEEKTIQDEVEVESDGVSLAAA